MARKPASLPLEEFMALLFAHAMKDPRVIRVLGAALARAADELIKEEKK